MISQYRVTIMPCLSPCPFLRKWSYFPLCCEFLSLPLRHWALSSEVVTRRYRKFIVLVTAFKKLKFLWGIFTVLTGNYRIVQWGIKWCHRTIKEKNLSLHVKTGFKEELEFVWLLKHSRDFNIQKLYYLGYALSYELLIKPSLPKCHSYKSPSCHICEINLSLNPGLLLLTSCVTWR